MRNNLKVYFLDNYFWEELKNKIEFSENFELLDENIAIYKIKDHRIAVLSNHDLVDELVLSEGGKENDDNFLSHLRQKRYSILFGSFDLDDL